MHRHSLLLPATPAVALTALGGRAYATSEEARLLAIQRLRATGEAIAGYPVALLAALIDADEPLAETAVAARVPGIDGRSAALALERLRRNGLVEVVRVDDEQRLVAAGAPDDAAPLPAVIRRRRPVAML